MPDKFATRGMVTEKNLVHAGQQGDAQALDTLFDRYQRTLFHSALRIMGNPQDAEDALQDGLFSAFRNLHYFEGRSQFSTWLTRVVTNAALMRLRSQAVRPTPAAAEPIGSDELPITERLMSKGPDPEQLFGRSEIRHIVNGHIDQLAPILRTAFVLRKVREFSSKESAKMLRVSEQTLKARLLRARRALAKSVNRSLLQGANPPPDYEFEP